MDKIIIDCPDCKGSGKDEASGYPYKSECRRCGGLGKIKVNANRIKEE